jgi:anti-sigma factor RsiW
MDDNLENLIADYLLDKMDSTARENFEQRLAAEPELAARVALEREVANTLDASSPENQLRANLRHISKIPVARKPCERPFGGHLVEGRMVVGICRWYC